MGTWDSLATDERSMPWAPAGESVRVAVIEEQNLFGEALTLVLERAGYAAVLVPTSAAVSDATLVRVLERLRPRTVLLDLDPGAVRDRTSMIPALTAAGLAVVVLTASTDEARWGECIGLGARRVIHKSAPLTEILATIKRIANGLPVLARDQRERLLAHWRHDVESAAEIRQRLDDLTPREAEVLGMLMDGKPVSDIAKQRFVAESTVRTQVKAVLAKLQVSSQITAVGLAHKAGWTPGTRDAAVPGLAPSYRTPARGRGSRAIIPAPRLELL